MSIRSRRGEFGLGAKGFAVKFYKIARLLWKLFFAMETNPICAGFELPFALFKYHERGSSYFYVSGDGRRERRKRRGRGRGGEEKMEGGVAAATKINYLKVGC